MVTREPVTSIPPTADHDRATQPGPPRRFLGYLWGIIVHPVATINALAAERSIGWAVAVAALGVVQVWGNMLLFAAFGYTWLGTLPLVDDPTAVGGFALADPIYVGWFGYLRVSARDWLPVFAALMPVLGLYQLVVVPGVAHLLSKPWAGQGTFEQMVNVLTFATVPGLVIGWLSEWLTGVPMNLLSGNPNWYVAMLQGAYGPAAATTWLVYSIAIYTVPWLWTIALGAVGIHRVQRIPAWAAVGVMIVAFTLWLLLINSSFVR
jgi:hypothetical protein